MRGCKVRFVCWRVRFTICNWKKVQDFRSEKLRREQPEDERGTEAVPAAVGKSEVILSVLDVNADKMVKE